MEKLDIEATCHRCFKLFHLSDKQIKFALEYKVLMAAWICPDCSDKELAAFDAEDKKEDSD